MSDAKKQQPAISPHNARVKDISDKLTKYGLPRIESALPRALGLNPRRFLHTAIQAVVNSPQLAECDWLSIVVATIQAAQCGIECDGINGALVPYGSKCTFVPMYQGIMASVYRSGLVQVIRPPRAVYEGDVWEYELGLTEKLRHIPNDDTSNQTWDKLRYVYCIARMESGQPAFVVMPKSAILAIKARSRAKSGPWATDPVPMALKTAVRNLCKYLPKSAEDRMLAKLIQLDDMVDAGLDPGREIEAELAVATGSQGGMAAINERLERASGVREQEPAVWPASTGEVSFGDDTAIEPLPEAQPAPEPVERKARRRGPASLIDDQPEAMYD